MQRSMSRYRGSSKSRCSCIGICLDADVRVDVCGPPERCSMFGVREGRTTRCTFIPIEDVLCVICHMPCVICYMPCVICYMPCIICYMPRVICHVLYVICHVLSGYI